MKAKTLPEYTIRRSKKARQIILRMHLHKGLEIVLPLGVDASCVAEILQKKSAWIEKMQQKMALLREKRRQQTGQLEFPSLPFFLPLRGGEVLYCVHWADEPAALQQAENPSHNSVLLPTNENVAPLSLQGVYPRDDAQQHPAFLPVSSKITPPQLFSLPVPVALRRGEYTLVVVAWLRHTLKDMAKEYFTQELQLLAKSFGLSYTSLRVGWAKTRWGSCTRKGGLNISTYLFFLPQPLIRYVLIHELCHTKQLNHSSQFWQEVFAVEPNALALDKSLRFAKKYIPVWIGM